MLRKERRWESADGRADGRDMRISGVRAASRAGAGGRRAPVELLRAAWAQRADRVPGTPAANRRRRDRGRGRRAGGERPVSLAGATLRAVAARLAGDLERTREALRVLTDSEQLEAELAAVRADTQAEISHAAQQEAIARRERMQADDAAETAIRAAEDATSAPTTRPSANATQTHARATPRRARRTPNEQHRTQSPARRRPPRRRPPPRPPLAKGHSARRTRSREPSTPNRSARRRSRAQARQRESATSRANRPATRSSNARRPSRTPARPQGRRTRRAAAATAERRAEQAEARAQSAVDRADRAEERARAERAELEREPQSSATRVRLPNSNRDGRPRRSMPSSARAPSWRRISQPASDAWRPLKRRVTRRSRASKPPQPVVAPRQRAASAPRTTEDPRPRRRHRSVAQRPRARRFELT